MATALGMFEGIRLYTGDRRGFGRSFKSLTRRRGGGRRLLYLNPHVCNVAADDPAFRACLRSASWVLPDGHGVVWAARRAGLKVEERLPLSDLLDDIARVCAEAGVPLYLWGGKKGVSKAAAKVLKTRHPGLHIAGCSHGYLGARLEKKLLNRLRKRPSWVVVVGMGSPKQEFICRELAQGAKAPVAVAAGNAAAFVSGLQRRAPAAVQALRLEWAWRLAMEPARMWRRYLIGNIRFVLRTLRSTSMGERRTL